MKGKTKKKEPKITTRVIKGKAKVVGVAIDGEPVANVIKISSSKPKTEAYLTNDPSKTTLAGVKKSLRLHRTEDAAVNRFGRRFPRITPRLRKLL